MDILKVTFTLLLLLFPLGQIIRFEFQNGAAITLNDIFVGVVVVNWLMVGGLRKQLLKTSLVKPIFTFTIIGFLSLIINMRFLDISQFFISSLYGVRWLIYAALFFVVSGFDFKFRRVTLIMMIIVGTIVVLGGYIQYFLYPSLRNLHYLGWDEHMYRMFSSFLDPNFAGAFFVLFLIFNIGILMNFFSKNASKLKIISIVILIFFTLGAVYLTFSRSTLLMLFTGVFIILSLFGKIRWIFLLVGISAVVFLITFKNFYIENINPFRIVSTEARLTSTKEAISIFEKNPLLGVGFNAYRYSQVRYGLRNEIGARTSHADAGVDNSFLFVLATTGIIGFIFYLYMWLKILKTSSHSLRVSSHNNFQKTIACVVIASIVGIFINAFFINSLFYPSIMLWVWVLVGLIDTAGDPSTSPRQTRLRSG